MMSTLNKDTIRVTLILTFLMMQLLKRMMTRKLKLDIFTIQILKPSLALTIFLLSSMISQYTSLTGLLTIPWVTYLQ